jgi:23S rRNA (adenine2503-C2)-methyltransferase
MDKINKKSLYSFTLSDLRDYFVLHSFAKYSADQLYGWLYKKYLFDFAEWTNVSKKVKAHIKSEIDMFLPNIIHVATSKDGTRKFLLEMQDGETVEAVAIPATDRLTLCVSSQVGCAIGCTFCHTSTMGLTRHLTPGEIVGQYVSVTKWFHNNVNDEIRISNIVFMGQGEPLHNYDNVKQAITVLMEDKGVGLGQRKITLSTSGLVPKIEKLDEFPPVNIAISLHAVRDDIRSELMPINKRYDLRRLFSAIKKIPLKAHRKITYEYLMIEDYNDQEIDLEGLYGLIDKKSSKINLIPFNEYPGSHFKRPTDERMNWFRDQLITKGYVCTIRESKGQDILAACGQLKSNFESNKVK